MLEKTIESPLYSKEIKQVNPKGNQSWLFIGYLSRNSNTLASWCEELTHWKRPWSWERLKVGEGKDRGWDGFMGITRLMDMTLSKLRVVAMGREAWHAAVHGVTKSKTRLRHWTELNWTLLLLLTYSTSAFRASHPWLSVASCIISHHLNSI